MLGIIYVVSYIPFHLTEAIIATMKASGGTTYITALVVGVIPLFLSIFGAMILIKSERKTFPIFFLAVILQIGVMFLGRYLFDFGYYYYAKNFYLLTYSLSTASALGVEYVIPILQRRPLEVLNKYVISGFLAIIVLLQPMMLGLYVSAPTGFFNTKPVLTQEQYDVAMWTKINLPQGELTYVADPPKSLWFYAVSNHPLKTKEKDWWMKPALDINEWLSNAKKDDVIVLLNLKEKWNSYPDQRHLENIAFLGGDIEVGQSFVPMNSRIERIEVYLLKKGNASDVKLTIYKGEISMENITLSASSIPENEWFHTVFDMNIEAESGNPYSFTLSSPGSDEHNYYYVRFFDKNVYVEGVIYSDYGTREGTDLYFRISPFLIVDDEEMIYGNYRFKILYTSGDNYVLQLVSDGGRNCIHP